MSSFKIIFFICVLTILGGFLHFYDLNWGAPFYFHPDERNIASSISQLHYPDQLNPHFFAYGTLPVYTIYFTGILVHGLSITKLFPLHNFVQLTNNFTSQLPFEEALVTSRFYSALFATLLIPILFFVGKKVKNTTTGTLAAIFGAASVGFIQFAHFGTFELWTTFFSVLLFWVCLCVCEKVTLSRILLLALLLGILVSIKISNFALIPLPIIVIFGKEFVHSGKKKQVYRMCADIVIVILYALLIFLITNPYVVFDYDSFRSSIRYESNVAFGTLSVFYTGEFKHTVPVIYQFIKVYPFLLNPYLTSLFVLALFSALYVFFTKKQKKLLLLLLFWGVLFFSQATVHVKWIRYMVPTIPFVYLIVAIYMTDLFKQIPHRLFNALFISIAICISIGISCAFFITAYVHLDTRMAAEVWAKKNIHADEPILSEVYDMGIVAFNQDFPHIDLFNFYDLDSNSPNYNQTTLDEALAKHTYFILPSQRVIKVRGQNKKDFPNGNKFYTLLQKNKTAFRKIYETPCDIFCKIAYLGDPIYSYEGTATVFDRPTVTIYKK